MGCPTQLPLKWLPDRVRADVLTLADLIRTRPRAGLTGLALVVACLGLTTLVFSKPDEPMEATLQTALQITPDHLQSTNE